jgi:hypothetical protein
MNIPRTLGAIGLGLALALSQARAADYVSAPAPIVYGDGCRAPVMVSPGCPLPPPVSLQPQPQPGQPQPGQPQPGQPAATDAFAQAPPAGTGGAPESFTPNMLGDQIGLFSPRFAASSSSTSFINSSSSSSSSSAERTLSVLPQRIKIAEGESPAPQTRVFYDFNYYNNVDKSLFVGRGTPFNPAPLLFHNVALYAHTLGGEYAFLNGDASLGVRVPINSINASPQPGALAAPTSFTPVFNPATGTFSTPTGVPVGDFSDSSIGDVSVIFKYVLCRDCATGSLVSGGVDLTFPFGQVDPKGVDPDINTNLVVQPYLAFILNRGNFFVQGFSSLALRTTRTDQMIWFNDLGVGYYLFREQCPEHSRMITAVAPTIEVHANDPLYQSSLFLTGLTDVIDLTVGATVELWGRATLAVGANTPLTAPRTYDFELIAQLNWRF